MKQLRVILILFVFIFNSCDHESVDIESTSIKSNEVSIELASNIALQFSNNQKFYQSNQSKLGLKSSNVERKIKNSKVINDDFGDPSIYVFNYEPSGFVMISGTQKIAPVLAYSDAYGVDLENMNSNLNDWISATKKQISYLKNAINVEISESTSQQWDMAAPPEDEEVVIPGPIVDQNVGPLL